MRSNVSKSSMKAVRSFFLTACLGLGFTFVLAAASTSAVAATAESPKSVTIGFIPGEDPKTLRENGLELAKLLQARLGVPVNIYISKNYSGLIEAMKEKKVDFAFFSAMTFVFAEKQAGAKVLLKKVWAGPYYYSTILTRSDSKIKNIKQLKGRKLAFVDEKSTSGFLYPKVHFKKLGIDADKYFGSTVFSGNHVESVRLLVEGKVDAIAVFSNDKEGSDTAWAQFSADAAKNAKVKKPTAKPLWTSAPIPNDPFCVRNDFYEKYPKVSHDLMFALIELEDDSKHGERFRELLGVSSLMLATSQQYEPVRELVRELDIKLQ